MSANENQIVVYQPNETVRLDVRLENETVWLTQSQMATLFGCSTDNIGLHLKNIYSCGELVKGATTEESLEVRQDKNHVPRHKISNADIKTFNVQYSKFAVRYNDSYRSKYYIKEDLRRAG